MSSFKDYRVKDISLAEFGRQEIILAQDEMPALMQLRAKYRNDQPLKGAKIINFAGGGAAYSYPKFLPYALSKVAVVRLTETLADEFKDLGYEKADINCVAPGAVKTKMLEEVISSGGLVKTTVSIDEPTNLVKFLLSKESDGITGRFIHSRDNYTDGSLFVDNENLKLRRRE